MDKRIDYDFGVKEETFYDSLTNEFHIKRTENIQPILESNLLMRNDEQATRDGIKNSLWKYAEIPNMVLAEWALQGVDINEPSELLKMVNKPENHRYKTTTKRHG